MERRNSKQLRVPSPVAGGSGEQCFERVVSPGCPGSGSCLSAARCLSPGRPARGRRSCGGAAAPRQAWQLLGVPPPTLSQRRGTVWPPAPSPGSQLGSRGDPGAGEQDQGRKGHRGAQPPSRARPGPRGHPRRAAPATALPPSAPGHPA